SFMRRYSSRRAGGGSVTWRSAARWTTASIPSTARRSDAGSVRSPTRVATAPGNADDAGRTNACTSAPALTRASRTGRAIAPVAPVTRTRRPTRPPGAGAAGRAAEGRAGVTPGSRERLCGDAALLEPCEIGIHHHGDQAAEVHFLAPAELLSGLAGVANQQVDLRRPEVPGVHLHVALPVEPDVLERDLHQLADRVRLARGHHVIVGRGLLEHQPHRLDVVARKAPVALRVEVAERERVGQPQLDARDAVGDLARDELEA